MGIGAYWYHWGGAAGGASESVRVSFGRQYGSAQTSTSLNLNPGIGHNGIGITHYETQPELNGPIIPFDIGFDPSWGYPPALDVDNLTEVTAEIDTTEDAQVIGTLTVFLFD